MVDGGTGRKEAPGLGDAGFPIACGEETVVADFDEPVGKNVEAEAAGELVEGKSHVLAAGMIGVVLVAESNGAGFGVEPEKSLVTNTCAMSVAGEVGEHGFRSGEGALGIDDPRIATRPVD